MELFTDAPEAANWNVFVDAKTGEELMRFNALHTAGEASLATVKAEHATARGFATEVGAAMAPYAALSPQNGTGASTFGGTLPLATFLYNNTYYLYDTTRGPQYIRTMTGNGGTTLPGSYVTDVDNNFTASTARAAVDAHYGAVTTYDYFLNTHARDSYDGAQATITSTVNHQQNYNNAFWNGQQMVYGDGDGQTFIPLVSLDIAAHELSHAVTGTSAGLIYQNESGALNEAFSDIMAVMVDRDDFLIGEDAYTPGTGGDALRYLDNPTAGDQPDHYSDRYQGSQDNGGVHINSGIANKQAYLLIAGGTHRGVSVAAIGRAKTEKIWYRALTSYFTSSTNFSGARQGTLSATADLYGSTSAEYAAVQNAWAAVGVGSASSGGGNGGGGTSAPQWYYETVNVNTPHNYPNNYDNTNTYTKAGATRVAMYFERFETERNYDFVYIKDAQNTTQSTYHGTQDAFWAVVDGATIKANLVSDYSVTAYGYRISRVAYYSDRQLLVQEGTPLAEAPQGLQSIGIQAGLKGLAFELAQNSPNPFGRSTAISYAVAEAGPVSLKVYDMLGRQVAHLVDDVKEPGRYTAELDASRMASGTYLYVLQAGTERETKRMTLVK